MKSGRVTTGIANLLIINAMVFFALDVWGMTGEPGNETVQGLLKREPRTARTSQTCRTSRTPLSTVHSQLSIAENPFRFSAYYHDPESGFDYCKARYYSPSTGSFTSRDTYDLPDRYAYCDGNPVMSSDPGGHLPWLKVIAPCALLGGIAGYCIDRFIRNDDDTSTQLEYTVAGAGIVAGLGAGSVAGSWLYKRGSLTRRYKEIQGIVDGYQSKFTKQEIDEKFQTEHGADSPAKHTYKDGTDVIIPNPASRAQKIRYIQGIRYMEYAVDAHIKTSGSILSNVFSIVDSRKKIFYSRDLQCITAILGKVKINIIFSEDSSELHHEFEYYTEGWGDEYSDYFQDMVSYLKSNYEGKRFPTVDAPSVLRDDAPAAKSVDGRI